ncbi:MAG: DUF5663 domain-containing protein [Patescibacteria group bacterium]|nr:DUF5663 domain-containing protein [Patescibacteria group bacterium]
MAKKEEKITIQGKDMIKELGLENLLLEGQVELIKKMSEVLYERIFLRLVNELSDEEAEEVSRYLEKKDYKKMDRYLIEKIPNFSAIWKEEIEKFQEEMIKRVKERAA